MRRLFPPCWPSSCSNTMLGVRPALRSLAEMFLPEMERGTARIVSAYLGSGLGRSSKYENGGSGSESRTAAVAADENRRSRRTLVRVGEW